MRCLTIQRKLAVLLLLVPLCVLVNSTGRAADGVEGQGRASHPQEPLVARKFSPCLGEKWIGSGIAYGPYREGQSPTGASPSIEQLTEDLTILGQHWQLIRMYGAGDVTANVIEIIHDKKLPLRVMVGAWIGPEHPLDSSESETTKDNEAANRREVVQAIELANRYPDEVIAISVGNETQVFWSGHRTHIEVLRRYLRQVREATRVPVTTADDFNFWNKPESQSIAAEIDFIVTHAYAMWGGVTTEDALPWTQRIYGEVCACHPGKTVVLGEAGWATQVHTEGEQAKLIKGEAGEAEQRRFYQEFTQWAGQHRICTFYFEAFDEPWKGHSHPDEVEKHWGLFHSNRQPKLVLREQAATPK